MERTTFLHPVDQNKIGDTFNRSYLVEISDSKADQVPETHNKRFHSIRCIVLTLSYNCIRKLKSYKDRLGSKTRLEICKRRIGEPLEKVMKVLLS